MTERMNFWIRPDIYCLYCIYNICSLCNQRHGLCRYSM